MAGITKSKAKDLTKGSELKVILSFAIPIYLSNLLQQCYNLTDVAIIGHSLGDDALTAIGIVSTIYAFFTSLIFGMGNGFSVAIAKFFGAADKKKMRQAVANTAMLALAWGLLITFAGVTLLKPLMRFLDTPEEVFDLGYSYAIIMISMILFTFCYNVFSGLLRAIGNSKAPLVFLFISVVTNIILDLTFVVKLGWGLRGAASATILAQLLSATVSFIYILKFVPELHFGIKDMKLNWNMIGEIFSAGISFAMMFAVVNLGTFILQGAIDGLGKTTIAAHVTARKVSELCMMMVGTMANAMATFAGQNHGAGKYDRIRTGLKKVLMLAFSIATVLIFLIYTIGEFMVKLISGSSNPELISTATFYLKVDLPFYYVLAIILITRSTLQGLGAKFTPIIASIMELVLKVITAKILVVNLGYLGIAICEPIIWTVCAVYILIVFFNNKSIKNSAPSAKTDEA